mmetsp:Transcript_15996/g.45920  ORF Transcript_15996/g.45920 Transcript_15996/m.45920 type:complete len:343 (-) Transcript_15996:174-1202(-)|eukprot:CAMPEP_0181057012 /NCGR_PEP_ID=MMETSP1070-20121207/20019_1 /TAXON_ID=265543 /ORGANISM="Minutocellus polymorphus, Strain NH13" /LENGTH=342 /DNA_ID=CAMNT_0023136389 /DNA_START=93 /DNA_END=1121 /DNA_ORIENTATION=-
MMISRSGLLLLLVSASVPNVVSAKVRGGISNEQAIDHRDLVEIVAKIQQGYDELKSQHNELHSKHNKLQKQYDAEKAERELQQQLPRSACNCASLTVAGDTFLGGDTTIYGDANLSGDITTITGTSLSIQSKKTDIDGDMLTIQTSGAGTRTGANSAINVAGGAITAASLTVSGETFLGGSMTVMGDANLSGGRTTVVGDEMIIKSSKTEIDGQMATIKSRSIANRDGEPATTSININGGSMAILGDSMMMRGFEFFTVNADQTSITGEVDIIGSTSIKGDHLAIDGGLVSIGKNTAMIVDGTVALNNVTSVRDLRSKNATITESLMMCGMFEAGLKDCPAR